MLGYIYIYPLVLMGICYCAWHSADGPTGEQRAEEGVSALSFSGRGDRLAALSPSPPTLRVWALAAGWSLQRGPAVLLPSQACTAQTRPFLLAMKRSSCIAALKGSSLLAGNVLKSLFLGDKMRAVVTR